MIIIVIVVVVIVIVPQGVVIVDVCRGTILIRTQHNNEIIIQLLINMDGLEESDAEREMN